MSDIDFGQFTIKNVAIPVMAAIITTLVVEYFAKPRLEARKARLMRDRAQFDQIVFDFQRVSAAISSLPTADQANKNKTYMRFLDIMLSEAKEGLYDLMRDMSRLSSRYVVNHHEHVSKTMLFIGYLTSQVELLIDDRRSVSMSELKDLASKLELFDVYYLVYVYMYDSQESWYKRLFWRAATKRKNNNKIDELFESLELGKGANK